ncbi:MAG: glycerol kinase, partial [Bacteroidetes bacterium]
MEKFILSFDQGTTSSRAIVFNAQGDMMGLGQKEFEQIYPAPGWVEHDALEIWSTQLGVAAEAVSKAGISTQQIAAIGITNQRETTVVWNKKTGQPIYNAIVWQDKRTATLCNSLKQQGYTQLIQEKTGLVIDAYFSATKLAWILDNVPNAREMAANNEL